MILVKNILKKYDNKKVVNDVSVNIEKGKITSFIGPNGAGKSTLLSIITRLMKRDLGEVYIEGKEIIELRYGINGKEELTQKEVADLLGISQSYISRIEKKVIKRLSQIIKN